MAQFQRAPGACPACDRTVPRLITPQGETYVCPSDGRLEYGPGRVPLEALGHHPDAWAWGVAQPRTGLQLVH